MKIMSVDCKSNTLENFVDVNHIYLKVIRNCKYYTIIIGPQPFRQDYNQASHSIYDVCVSFIHKRQNLRSNAARFDDIF